MARQPLPSADFIRAHPELFVRQVTRPSEAYLGTNGKPYWIGDDGAVHTEFSAEFYANGMFLHLTKVSAGDKILRGLKQVAAAVLHLGNNPLVDLLLRKLKIPSAKVVGIATKVQGFTQDQVIQYLFKLAGSDLDLAATELVADEIKKAAADGVITADEFMKIQASIKNLKTPKG